MTLIQYLLATLPGIIICFYVIRSDKFEKEPMGALLLAFIIGTLMIVPVILLSNLFEQEKSNLVSIFFNCFISIALIEEGLKLLIVLVLFYNRPFFNEPFDGIIYTVMLGMGFATAENLLFAGKHPSLFYIQRAFTTEIAHGAFSIILGYFVGQAKFSLKAKQGKLLSAGLLITVLLHGTYDLFLSIGSFKFVILFSLLVLFLSICLAYRFILIQVEKPPVRLD